MIPGLQPLEAVTMVITMVKTGIDVGLVLAGHGSWADIRDDAIGFALFGVASKFTALSRTTAVRAAGEAAKSDVAVADRLAEDVRALDKVKDAERIAQKQSEIRSFTADSEKMEGIKAKLAKDPVRPVWKEVGATLHNNAMELPDQTTLDLFPRAAHFATASQFTNDLSHAYDAKGINDTMKEWGLPHIGDHGVEHGTGFHLEETRTNE